jgi:hypothetical protein
MRLNRSRKINFIIPLLLHPTRSEKNLQDLKDSCSHPEPYRHPDESRDPVLHLFGCRFATA